MSFKVNATNVGIGVLGGILQGALIKKRKRESDEFKAKFDQLIRQDSGVTNSKVTYGMPNATEMDSNGMKTRDFAGGTTTTFGDKPKKPDVVTGDNATALEKTNELFGFTKLSDGSYMQDSDGGRTTTFAHGGVIGDTTPVGGFYHGGQGGVGDRMMWQKENFKK